MGIQDTDIRNKCFSYVLAVEECGTITSAADKLFISQPALSRYLRNLEARLGIVLFDRIDNRLYLTAAGKLYVQYAQQIIHLESQAAKELRLLQKEARKCIRLGLPQHWVSFLMPPLMESLHAALPDVNLEIIDTNSNELEQLLLQYEVDITISREPNDLQFISSRLLHPDPMYLVAPKSIASTLRTVGQAADGCPIVDLSELPRLKYILQEDRQTLRKHVDKVFCSLEATPTPTLICRSVEASMRLVGDEYGCCFASGMHRRSVYLHNAPSFFLVDHPDATMSLHVSYPAKRELPKHILQFIRYVSGII